MKQIFKATITSTGEVFIDAPPPKPHLSDVVVEIQLDETTGMVPAEQHRAILAAVSKLLGARTVADGKRAYRVPSDKTLELQRKIALIRALTNHEELERIAESAAYSLREREAAIDTISDEHILAKIAKGRGGVFAQRSYAASRITDESLLADVARHARPQVQEAAVERIKDPALLATLGEEPNMYFSSENVLDRLTVSSEMFAFIMALKEPSRWDPNLITRRLISRLTDQSALTEIAISAEHKRSRAEALYRVVGDIPFKRIAAEGKYTEERTTAKNHLEYLARRYARSAPTA